MKVYITTAGEYSDYRIDRVFSTREKAQAWIDKFTPHLAAKYQQDHPDSIEEFEIDEAAELWPREAWSAKIILSTGEINAGNSQITIIAGLHDRGVSRVWPSANYAHAYSFESAEHAEKLAVETRQKWLREKGQP